MEKRINMFFRIDNRNNKAMYFQLTWWLSETVVEWENTLGQETKNQNSKFKGKQ